MKKETFKPAQKTTIHFERRLSLIDAITLLFRRTVHGSVEIHSENVTGKLSTSDGDSVFGVVIYKAVDAKTSRARFDRKSLERFEKRRRDELKSGTDSIGSDKNERVTSKSEKATRLFSAFANDSAKQRDERLKKYQPKTQKRLCSKCIIEIAEACKLKVENTSSDGVNYQYDDSNDANYISVCAAKMFHHGETKSVYDLKTSMQFITLLMNHDVHVPEHIVNKYLP